MLKEAFLFKARLDKKASKGKVILEYCFWQGLNLMKKNHQLIEIQSGEVYASDSSIDVIGTLLGSCVAVCLFDKTAAVGGMNHYMLPYGTKEKIHGVDDLRYGTYAIDYLILQLQKYGARLERLQAKVFGGGRVIPSGQFNIAEANVNFAMEYLSAKNIPIMAMDVGGTTGRKIFYRLEDHKVFVKKTVAFPEYRDI